MNINSRIDWKAGMAISAQTFLELDENLRHRQQAATRSVNLSLNSLRKVALSATNWKLSTCPAWPYSPQEKFCTLTKKL